MPRIDPEGWNLLIALRAYLAARRGLTLDETPGATLIIPVITESGAENDEVPMELLVDAGREEP